MDSDVACLMSSTPPGGAICDFDEAWTINGLMATTPPFGQAQSMGLISLAKSQIAPSLNTPRVCVRRTTLSRPLPAVESLRETRGACPCEATTRDPSLSIACGIDMFNAGPAGWVA